MLFRALKDKGGEKSLVSSPGPITQKKESLSSEVGECSDLVQRSKGVRTGTSPPTELWTRNEHAWLVVLHFRPLGITPASAKPPGRVQTPCT